LSVRVRYPRYAGSFYNGSRDRLRSQLEWCFLHRFGPGSLPETSETPLKRVVTLISPHAGYIYSGPVAAHAYHFLASDGKPDVAVLLGPNHTGLGSAISIYKDGLWRTPLGDLSVDSDLAGEIVRESGIIDVDDSAHNYEHSIEVQLPFLQYVYSSPPRIVPIAFLMQDLESSLNVGEAVGKALLNRNAVVIASTDLTHYEPQSSANEKDKAVIEAITSLDEKLLYEIVEERSVSMCGYGPTISAIAAAKALGAKSGKLLCYKTSGDVTGDFSAVVGYASIALLK